VQELDLRTWDDLPAAFAKAAVSPFPLHPDTPKDEVGKSCLVIVLDCNAPTAAHDSDSTASETKNVWRVAYDHGVQTAVVLMFMPKRRTRGADALEEQLRISNGMRDVGFGYQQSVGIHMTKTDIGGSECVFWQDARLLYPYPTEEAAKSESWWYNFSELARTTQIGGALPNIKDSDLGFSVTDAKVQEYIAR
jgi:hypothetical protein